MQFNSFASHLLVSALASVAALVSPSAWAEVVQASAPAITQAPDAFVKMILSAVFSTIKSDTALQSGDIHKIVAVVDSKIVPNVNFQRMTAAAMGPRWRQATPEQQKRLQDEFKTLLVYTYAGAVSQIRDQTVEFKPMRSRPEDTEVVMRTVIRGKGDTVQLDYRLEKSGDSWKIYDVNVMGAWLVQTYQNNFAQEVNASGIDGLINKLVERNKQLANRKVAD